MKLNIIDKETKREDVLEAYRNYQDTQPNGFESIHKSTVGPIFCEVPQRSKVLDIGCNSGELMKLLKEKGCDVTGVDVGEKVLEIAQKKGLNAFYADAENLPFKDKTFDVVIMREVITHIHDRIKALKEARRVLKDDGMFLGSAPHRNLEVNVWDDKAPHHKYYDEKEIMSDLSSVFEETHLQILNGAQFNPGFMMSFIADKPAEFLWKSGRKGIQKWEQALHDDKKTLRVWFGPTQPPGDVYYRMTGFGEKMRELRETEIGWEDFSYESNDQCSSWQKKVLVDENGDLGSVLAMEELHKVLTIANPWVFQLTYHDEVLSLFEFMKEKYPEKKLITESDDFVFNVPGYNVASHPYRPNSDKERLADEQYKLSDAIVVSTSHLKEKLSGMYPDKKIYVIPNSIDFDLWEKAPSMEGFKPKGKNVIRLIYTGCGNHSGDLELVKPVLLTLLDEFENLEIVMSAEFQCFQDIKNPRFIVSDKWVSIMNYPSMVKGWEPDIGIAPLRDNDFNRSKSNLRWLEYSVLKIPTVMSHVKPFSESVVHNHTGLLCKSQEDWYRCLKELIQSKVQRMRLGHNAHREVKRNFNLKETAKYYRSVLEEIKRGC